MGQQIRVDTASTDIRYQTVRGVDVSVGCVSSAIGVALKRVVDPRVAALDASTSITAEHVRVLPRQARARSEDQHQGPARWHKIQILNKGNKIKKKQTQQNSKRDEALHAPALG